jgi:hypothetical protein
MYKREFDTSYSLFIMVLKEMVLMESMGQPAAASPASPLLSSQSVDLFHVFFVSATPLQNHKRGVYIVDLGQVESMEPKFAAIVPMSQRWAHHAASMSAHVVPPLLCLVAFPIDFSSDVPLFSRKMIWQKDWVCLKFERSLKLQTCKNKKICFTVLKQNERGLFRKSPDSMENMSRSL